MNLWSQIESLFELFHDNNIYQCASGISGSFYLQQESE
jgi:hypothetical protein